MATRSDKAPARWRRPFLAWLDGIEAGWAIPTLLLGFVVLWTAFLKIAHLSGDLHPMFSKPGHSAGPLTGEAPSIRPSWDGWRARGPRSFRRATALSNCCR